MTQIEWQQLEATVAAMTNDERQRLAAILTPTDKPGSVLPKPIIGLFADEPDLIEQIIQDIYIARETHSFRAGE